MKLVIVATSWFATIASIAWAGAWKLGEGGGWLIALAALMVAATTIKTENFKD